MPNDFSLLISLIKFPPWGSSPLNHALISVELAESSATAHEHRQGRLKRA